MIINEYVLENLIALVVEWGPDLQRLGRPLPPSNCWDPEELGFNFMPPPGDDGIVITAQPAFCLAASQARTYNVPFSCVIQRYLRYLRKRLSNNIQMVT